MKFDLSTIILNDLNGDGTKPHLDAKGEPQTLGGILAQVILIGQQGMNLKEARRRKALSKTLAKNGHISIDHADRTLLITLAESGGNPVMICIVGDALDPEDKEPGNG